MLGQPWAIEENALRTIVPMVRNARGFAAGADADVTAPLEAPNTSSLAIVSITGPIFPRSSLFQALAGGTPLTKVRSEINAALRDSAIGAIMLDIDSPGGLVTGVSAFAEFVRSADQEKPVLAHVSGMAASAAYWIASAARELTAHRSAQLGSIGLVAAVPVQEATDRDGEMTYEIVSSNAENKIVDPRTDAGQAQIRYEIDAIEAVFIDDVARYRKVSAETVRSKFGRGGLFLGQQALRLGMIDGLGGFDDVADDIEARFAGGEPDDEPQGPIPIGSTSSAPVHAAASSELKPAAQAVERIQVASPASIPDPIATAPAIDPSLPPDERAKAEWEAHADLRDEFGSLSIYQAYRRAEEAGRVRIIGRRHR